MQCGICDKEMPLGVTESPHGVTICGSCVLTPLPSPDAIDFDKAIDVGFDLSFLDDTKKSEERQRPKPRSLTQVQMALSKTVLKHPNPTPEVEVKTLKLKSNHLRDRVYPMEDLMLHFDGDGVAEFPEARLETVTKHMRLRPNRFRLLGDEKPPPPRPAPQAALEAARAALVEAKAREAAKEEAAEQEAAPTPEPEPKAKPVAKKKRTSAKKKSTKKKTEASTEASSEE